MGRLSGCLSVTQELTTHVEIERAVAHAVRGVPCTTLDFGAAADVGVDGTAKSRYSALRRVPGGRAPRRTSTRSRRRSTRDSVTRTASTASTARARWRFSRRVVVPLARGGARRFLEEVTRGNVQGKFPRIIDDTKKKLLWKHAPAEPRARQEPMNRIGVAIVGVNGAVASTVIAGVELMKRGLAPRIGMVTERTDARIAESITELLDFAPLEDLVFAGWDVQFANVLRGGAAPQGAAAARARRR